MEEEPYILLTVVDNREIVQWGICQNLIGGLSPVVTACVLPGVQVLHSAICRKS